MVHPTPVGTLAVGPLERRFSEITNAAAAATDFKGSVVGFNGEHSKALAGVANLNMISDAQTAKWQARYGRDPTEELELDACSRETQRTSDRSSERLIVILQNKLYNNSTTRVLGVAPRGRRPTPQQE
jgi:hypothetical protein